jgi:hypothetical protein
MIPSLPATEADTTNSAGTCNISGVAAAKDERDKRDLHGHALPEDTTWFRL